MAKKRVNNEDNDIHIEIDPDIFGSDLITIDHILPRQLYIIPLRYRAIFPGIVTPLIITQGKFSEAIDKVIESTRIIGLVLLKDDDIEEITISDLYNYGTAAKILKKITLPDGGINILINTIKRFRITDIITEKPYFIAQVDYLDDEVFKKDIEIKALTRSILSQLKILSDNNPFITEEMYQNLAEIIEQSMEYESNVLLTGMQIPPNYGRDYAEKFASSYKRLAERYKIDLVPFILDGFEDDKTLFQSDGIHPSASAQPIILENVWKYLGPML